MKKSTTVRRRKMPYKHYLFPNVSKKTRKEFYLEASKYLSDITKLIFGGVILTNILNFNIDKRTTFVIGFMTVIILIGFSFVLFLKGKE